jgi:signal transduction histidine kinase
MNSTAGPESGAGYVAPDAQGIAVLCSRGGTILRILQDEVGAGLRMEAGQPFSLLLDRGSLGKSVEFLSAIRTRNFAFGWELNVIHGGKPSSMYFSGGAIDDLILVVGARTNTDILNLYEDLIRMNNEQNTELRLAMKDQYERLKAVASQDSSIYDEVTRLNNEVIAAQRQLAKANAELKRLDEMKNRFLGMASHNLRSPLGAILTYSEFLIDEAAPAMSEEHRQFLSVIRQSSEFMLKLVNDLLDISTIESGQLRLDLEPVDLAQLIDHSITINRLMAAKKSIAIEFLPESRGTQGSQTAIHGMAAIPVLMLDPGKIEQVANNLITNAVKFSRPGTAIEVDIRVDEAEVAISVRDHGLGIPAGERDKLFRFFGRTSVRATAGEKSSGLGLAISQKIIAGHGGRMQVESEEGEGSIFTFRLPCPQAGKAGIPGAEIGVPATLEGGVSA